MSQLNTTGTQLVTSGKILHGWDPEDPAKWDKGIAWRTLIITTATMAVGFSAWYLVSAIAPLLNQIGFDLSDSQLYALTAIAGLSAGLFRLVFMFLPPIVGTRKLVAFSAILFLLPMLGWFSVVQRPDNTPYWELLAISFASGFGGGVFAGFMPSTGYFFPKRLQGTALGLQAGIGNFGISFIQLVAPWLMGFTLMGVGLVAPQRLPDGSAVFVHNPAIFMAPWTIVCAIIAWLILRDVPVKVNFRQQIDIFSNPNTWIMTLVYLMTFGAFAGFAAQFALIINQIYGAGSSFADTVGVENLPKGAAYAFLGPLIGAAVRAAWGPLCDKFGGAIWTFIGGIGMTVFTAAAALFLNPTDPDQFWWFLGAMLAMFFFTGLGNAGTFKQMPMILPKTQAGGVIGWTSAIAAFGPFIVGVLLSFIPIQTFYWGCVVFFAICTALVWIFYARPKAPYPG
ncbi:MFS transporter [Corynebacterium casei]|uniref:MFS transporter n=1 Tax=Corynebacterium casei TaxID=160386 RepID=UPI003F8F3E02